MAQQCNLQRALGNAAQIRAERDALEQAIDQTQRELAALANQLVAREPRAPGTRAREIFGERPDIASARQQRETDIQPERYRVQHEISDPSDVLGPGLD